MIPHFHIYGKWEEIGSYDRDEFRKMGGQVVGTRKQKVIRYRRKCLFCTRLQEKEKDADRPVVLNWT